MGIDFGERRIGVAFSDAERNIATGYTTIDCKRDPQFLQTLVNLSVKESAVEIVVGYPNRTDGLPGGKTEDVDRFIHNLKKLTNLPIHEQDESFTSTQAREVLRNRSKKLSPRAQKIAVDRVAASIILQDYLNGGR